MQLLIACGLDANDHVVPCAWAIVLSEDEATWTWFFEHIRKSLLEQSGYLEKQNLVIMSDREKDLARAVAAVLPEVHPAHCCQHIAANIQARYGQSSVSHFWKCACARTSEDFKTAFEALQDHNLTAAQYVADIPIKT